MRLAAAAHVSGRRDYFQVARWRKWIILQAPAQVLLSSQNLAARLAGTQAVGNPPDDCADIALIDLDLPRLGGVAAVQRTLFACEGAVQ